MKFAIEGSQRHFFRTHHTLEVQGLVSEAQLKELNIQIKNGIAERLKIEPRKLSHKLPSEVFTKGRDVSRANDYLKKFILNAKFAEIASDLVEFRPLRFGFDQFFSTANPALEEKEEFNPYKALCVTPKSFKEITCLQGVLCGLMICLEGENNDSQGEAKNDVSVAIPSIFSKIPGNAVFFSPEAVIDFNELISNETYRYLMIVYTHPTAIYYLEENDPQAHLFKNLGYVFGDRLKDKLNPIIYR